MPLKIKCFRCKATQEIDLKPEQVHPTKNDRYVANSQCPSCGRKLTTLIKKEEYNKILKPAEV